MKNPLISIIVCTYNRVELLQGCLESLMEQTVEPSLFEVIIVDNNSTDNTLEVANRFAKITPNIKIFTEMNQGLSHARNCGWREARGEYVAYIDDDARAASNWCDRILYAFNTVTPTPVAVGGQIHPFYEEPPPSWFTGDFEIRTWGEKAGFLELPHARYGFSGSNMAFQRKILKKYGGFSTLFGMVGCKLRIGEDTEFFYRIYNEEPRFWYDPYLCVYHWTPPRNCTLSYRFVRGYRVGESAIQIQRRRLLSIKYARELVCLFRLILSAPYRCLFAEKHMKTEAAIFLQELGTKCGFLFGKNLL